MHYKKKNSKNNIFYICIYVLIATTIIAGKSLRIVGDHACFTKILTKEKKCASQSGSSGSKPLFCVRVWALVRTQAHTCLDMKMCCFHHHWYFLATGKRHYHAHIHLCYF